MADLGDGDLSLQRHVTADDGEGQYEALGSPELTFEPSPSASYSIEGVRSPARSYFERPLELQEEGHDIGDAIIQGPAEDGQRRSVESSVSAHEPTLPDAVPAKPEIERPETVPDEEHLVVQTENEVEETKEEDSRPETPPLLDKVPSSPNASRTPKAIEENPLSEFSHQQLTQAQDEEEDDDEEDDGDVWQDMPVYAPYDVYDDDGKLIAKEHEEESAGLPGYASLGQAGGSKGYTKVMVDEDAQSATSMDENTAYLFDKRKQMEDDDEDEPLDALGQMNETKNLLTDSQRIAYVGVVRLAAAEMTNDLQRLQRTRGAKKAVDFALESTQLWSQKVMLRLYSHMELDSAEQIMIEQLSEHGLQPSDLTPALMQNARVKNPILKEQSPQTSLETSRQGSIAGPSSKNNDTLPDGSPNGAVRDSADGPPPYEEHDVEDLPGVRTPSQLPKTDKLDIDLRWTVLCDLFLLLISDSIYDARSRTLLERVGSFLDVPWIDICRFEKRVTDALEMQDAELKEDLTEAEHMSERKKSRRKRKLIMMGLATVGGGLVIGLSAGLLAPVIGAGLAAGLTTVGISGGGTFLAGMGGAALIGTTGVVTGGTIGGKAAARRMGSVKTFEYLPLFNNRRVNLIITLAGWMTGKVDDVRLPYSTIDPVMGDIVSLLWEPEMLRSMGDTINILATEALTQGLQQILGSTILISLMAALQLPLVLTKLSYLIDNPWSVSMARADMAGLIMADSIVDRNLGARPITLVGFSLGARVIFSCLRELANKGAVGLVQNVYIFGSPVVVSKDDWLKVQTVVSGRFVNGYATNDWILGYLFRATAGGIMRVAGLAKVDLPGIENVNVTEFVPGHMSYRKAMPRCLREVGWAIESDDFTEIEDPDPENHANRQRELINEIEEARKELQKKPEKKRWFWKSKKERAQKKEWETYEEKPMEPTAADYANEQPGGVLFDVEAIRREAVELAAQGIEIKDIQGTQPPLRVASMGSIGSSSNLASTSTSTPTPESPTKRTKQPDLRGTKSYEVMPSTPIQNNNQSSGYRNSGYNGTSSRSLDIDDHADSYTNQPHDADGDGEISMTFEPSSPVRYHATSPLPSQRTEQLSRKLSSKWSQADLATRPAPSSPRIGEEEEREEPREAYGYQRHENISGNNAPQRNVWDEEDEFGREREEVSMTFE